ncbi:hypothetical protein [Acidithiobacillus sp.]|uniref:hypothetical protein n=1 Tax=Acidithiobacillus sp. TaxID=1872118 RepID=UPI00260482A1|nr:hypothetical protein [Acidithiobacillus sp.]MDD2749089.1 hypothetical protein [Acidithiobacillus sp.]MDD5280134.1 hypothetical protein [Acidithiobacillus sp.]
MNKQSDRKEPVLEETLEDNDDAPLLLTRVVREGLPPQLWRHEESPAMPELNSKSHKTPASLDAGQADKFSMRWEEAESDSTAAAVTEQTKTYTQSEVRWQPAEIVNPQQDFEDRDLEAALKRMRQGLSKFTASRSEPTFGEKSDSDFADQVVTGLVSEHLKPAPTNPEPAEEPVDEVIVDAAGSEPEASIADAVINPSNEEHQEFVEKHPVQEPVPDNPPLDLDFLKDFEQLLFQEIERRVINEMEEQMTQHLQKVWKEQVSLTLMRTLALEGIKLRESLAQEMRASLPEILQRVLHNGLEQITPTEPDR